MPNSPWIAFLRQLSPSVHNQLSITTRIGQELAVQHIFRIDSDYLVYRGRLSGTTEEARVYVMPYDELHAISFQKPLKEHQVDAILSGNDPTKTAEQEAIEAADLGPAPAIEAEPPAAPAPKQPEPPPPVSVAPADSKSKPGSKVLLLERVRARLAAAGKPRTAETPK